MDKTEISLILSVVASTLAVLSFCGTIWRIWRDRPRLILYISKTIFETPKKDKEFPMATVRACNIGYRPILVTGCMFVGEKSLMSVGIDDEIHSIFGIQKQVFPALIEPGDTLTFHPIGINTLEKNWIDPGEPKVFFDQYKYMFLFDNFRRAEAVRVIDMRWELRMDKSHKWPSTREKITNFFERRRFLKRARKSLNVL